MAAIAPTAIINIVMLGISVDVVVLLSGCIPGGVVNDWGAGLMGLVLVIACFCLICRLERL
jgi:hypothetical protein